MLTALHVTFSLYSQEVVEIRIGGIASRMRETDHEFPARNSVWTGTGLNAEFNIGYKLSNHIKLISGVGYDLHNYIDHSLDTTFTIKRRMDFVNLMIKGRAKLGSWSMDIGYQVKYNVFLTGITFADYIWVNGIGIERNKDVVNRLQNRFVAGLNKDFNILRLGMDINLPLNNYFSTEKYSSYPLKYTRFAYLELSVGYVFTKK